VLDAAQLPPSGKGHSPPCFLPMSVLAKWLPILTTAELLLVLVLNFHCQADCVSVHVAFTGACFDGVSEPERS